MDRFLPNFSVHGDSPGKNTGVSCHFLLQGIFPIQGQNLHFLNLMNWQADFLSLSITASLLAAILDNAGSDSGTRQFWVQILVQPLLAI